MSEPLPKIEVPEYRLVRPIGGGSYGQVWLAENALGGLRAVKVVQRRQFREQSSFEREFRGIRRFEPISRSHPGLVQILHVGQKKELGYYYYVMELADPEGGELEKTDLATYVPKTLETELKTTGRLAPEICSQLGSALAAGLQHLHGHGLIHRDLKPSNIIFVNGNPKIADIGLVALPGSSNSIVGTEGFIPPEGPGSIQADIYGLGKVLYEASTGFDRKRFPELPGDISEQREREQLGEINEIVLRSCSDEPSARYQSASQMVEEFHLIQAGKSLKRLRALEGHLSLLGRLCAVVVALVISVFFVDRYRAAERQATERLKLINYQQGSQYIRQKDYASALPHFSEALRLSLEQGTVGASDRLRFGMTLSRCPQLRAMWFTDAPSNYLAIDPQTGHIVTADQTGNIELWTADGQHLRKFVGHEDEVEVIHFSEDGERLLSAGNDSKAIVWPFRSEDAPLYLPHPDKVYCASFSSNPDVILTGCRDGIIRVWRISNGEPKIINQWLAHFSERRGSDGVESVELRWVKHIDLCATQSLLASCGQDGTMKIWAFDASLPTRPHRLLERIKVDSRWVYEVDFSSDGRFLAGASFNGSAVLWDREASERFTLAHGGEVQSVSFRPGTYELTTTSWDETARVWNCQKREEVIPPVWHLAPALCSRFGHPQWHGNALITTSQDRSVRVWDLDPAVWQPPNTEAYVSEDGLVFGLIAADSITLIDGRSWEVKGTVGLSEEIIERGFTLSRDGSHFAMAQSARQGSDLTKIQVWDSKTRVPDGFPIVVDFAVSGLALDNVGARILIEEMGARGEAGKIHVFDARDGSSIGDAPFFHDEPYIHSSLNPELDPLDRYFAVSAKKTATLYDLQTGEVVREFLASDRINRLAFSPDGSMLALGSGDSSLSPGHAMIIDLASFAALAIPESPDHGQGIVGIGFTDDSDILITSGLDNTASLWALPTCNPAGVSYAREDLVWDAVSDPVRQLVLTADQDGVLQLWSSPYAIPVSPPLDCRWPLRECVLPSNGFLVGFRESHDARFWPVVRDERSLDVIVAHAELLAGRHLVDSIAALKLDLDGLRDRWELVRHNLPETMGDKPGILDLPRADRE